MSGPKQDVQVILTPEVEAAAAQDPELAEMIRDFVACFRQGVYGVETGQYKSLDDALEALLGSRPEPVTEEDDDFVEALNAFHEVFHGGPLKRRKDDDSSGTH